MSNFSRANFGKSKMGGLLGKGKKPSRITDQDEAILVKKSTVVIKLTMHHV